LQKQLKLIKVNFSLSRNQKNYKWTFFNDPVKLHHQQQILRVNYKNFWEVKKIYADQSRQTVRGDLRRIHHSHSSVTNKKTKHWKINTHCCGAARKEGKLKSTKPMMSEIVNYCIRSPSFIQCPPKPCWPNKYE
jgi:hypothetical protein